MNRNSDKLVLFLLDKFSVSHTHHIIADAFLSEVARCFVMLIQVFGLLGSEVAKRTQNLYHLVFIHRGVLFSNQHINPV